MQESQLFPGVGNVQRVPGVPCKQPRRRKGALCHRGDGDTALGAHSPPGPAPCGVQELWRWAGGTDRGVPTSANIPTAPPPPPSPADKTPPGQWAAHVGCPACHGMKESKQGEQTALAFSSCSSLARRQSQHPDGTHPTPAWGKNSPAGAEHNGCLRTGGTHGPPLEKKKIINASQGMEESSIAWDKAGRRGSLFSSASCASQGCILVRPIPFAQNLGAN